ncbi:unnamed protein product [Phytophthora fragariaefolia]|uniref:Unnamed protein product n=1 Tax=Phytophthora fragariaefolia TaxID=1490495 RepID=A0A9W7CSL0_9STRA|nr:unnamed protein product [Phytophthora fragariaefolia]
MEDHRVNKALSDYGTEAELTAYLIVHYPRMKESQANGLAVQRMEAAAGNADVSIEELLAWSSHLAAYEKEQHKQSQGKLPPPLKKLCNESKIIELQSSVIYQLLQHINRQDERMDNVEDKMDGVPPQDKRKKRQQEPYDVKDKPKCRRTSVTYLHATWFAWFPQEPRMWQGTISKQQKSNATLLLAFMKLFLEEGFTLDPTAPDYRDRVLDAGKRAEEAVLRFLCEGGVGSRGFGPQPHNRRKTMEGWTSYHTIAERIEFLGALERNKWGQEEASEGFGIPRTTLLGYIAAKDDQFSTESDPWSKCFARPGLPPPTESSEVLIAA